MWEHTSDSIGYYVKRLVHEYRDRPAIISYEGYSKEVYSYRDLYDLSNKLSCQLYSMGLRKGDHVLIWAPNGPYWVLSFLVAAYSGITLVPVDILASKDFAQKIAEQTKPKLAICANHLIHEVKEWIECPVLSTKELKRLAQEPVTHPPQELIAVTGHDVLEIVFTSGTTSEPKGAMIRQHQVVANTLAVRQRIIYHDSWKFLSILPMSHLFEQVIGVIAALYFGCSLVTVSGRSMPEVFAIGRQEGVTHIAAVPALLEHLKLKIVQGLGLSNEGLSTFIHRLYKLPFFIRRILTWPIRRQVGPQWQALICGGASLDVETQKFWEALGIRIVIGYGMTEASPIISCNSMSHRPLGSVGYSLAGQLLKLSEDGEVLIAGENVITGYFQRDNQDHFDSHGWFHTGDIGCFDEKGQLYITGRKKEMIVGASGMNIFPQDIENILNRMEAVAESVVMTHPQNPQDLIALIIPKENHKLDQTQCRELLKNLNAQLSTHQRLSSLLPWPYSSFEKTHTLKLKRKNIEAKYKKFLEETDKEEKEDTQDAQAPHSPLIKILCQISQKPAQSILDDTNLRLDLGFDSVDMVNLWMYIQNELKVTLNPSAIDTVKSVADLKETIELSKKQKPSKQPRFFFHKMLCQIVREPLYWLSRLILPLLWKIEIVGSAAEPSGRRPLIYIANHASHLDSVAIALSIPSRMRRRMRIAAAYDHFFSGLKRIKGLFMQAFFPVFGFHRDKDIFENMHKLQVLFDRKHPLLIFPEGTRSRSGNLAPFKGGIGLIVEHFDAMVQPIYIEGTHSLWPPHQILPRPGKIKVTYLEPISFQAHDDAAKITASLYKKYKKLSSE